MIMNEKMSKRMIQIIEFLRLQIEEIQGIRQDIRLHISYNLLLINLRNKNLRL